MHERVAKVRYPDDVGAVNPEGDDKLAVTVTRGAN
jgi:hypothetical protein